MLVVKKEIMLSALDISGVGIYSSQSRNSNIKYFNNDNIEEIPNPIFIHEKMGSLHLDIESNFKLDCFYQANKSCTIFGGNKLEIKHEFHISIKREFDDVVEKRNGEIYINDKKVALKIVAITSDPFSVKRQINDLKWLLGTEKLSIIETNEITYS